MREQGPDGFSQPSQVLRTRPHPDGAQYSPSALVQYVDCSSAVSQEPDLVVSENGTDSLSSICARSMLNASPGFSPSRESTFSACFRRFRGTRARKSTVVSAMLKSARKSSGSQGRSSPIYQPVASRCLSPWTPKRTPTELE